jgi:clathrin heavy chain
MADKQFDSAVKIMMERAPSWDNDLFLDSAVKVRNSEVMYKAVSFYLTMHPTLFTRMMEVLEDHVDHSRVVNQLRRTGDWALQLGQPYMKSVQKHNLSPVNEALNEVRMKEHRSVLFPLSSLSYILSYIIFYIFLPTALHRRRGLRGLAEVY